MAFEFFKQPINFSWSYCSASLYEMESIRFECEPVFRALEHMRLFERKRERASYIEWMYAMEMSAKSQQQQKKTAQWLCDTANKYKKCILCVCNQCQAKWRINGWNSFGWNLCFIVDCYCPFNMYVYIIMSVLYWYIIHACHMKQSV